MNTLTGMAKMCFGYGSASQSIQIKLKEPLLPMFSSDHNLDEWVHTEIDSDSDSLDLKEDWFLVPQNKEEAAIAPIFVPTVNAIKRGKIADGIDCQKIKYSKNLYLCPQKEVFEAKSVFIGDAHGNTLRLIYDLVYCGAVRLSCNILWKCLINIINSSAQLTDEQYNHFVEVISEGIILSENAPNIVFLGDLLADRQSNDILTLSLLHILDTKGLQFKIILSNHDLVFLRYYLIKVTNFIDLYPDITRSVINFSQFCKIGTTDELVKSEDLCLDVIYESYLSHLELFTYDDDLKLFSCHATVDTEQVKKLFKVLKVFELYMALDIKKESNKNNIALKIAEIEKNHGENFEYYFQTNYKDADKINAIYSNISRIFNSIKENSELFKQFIQLPEIIQFCENRTITNFFTPFPGANTLIQGHDLRPDYFSVDPNEIFPPSIPKSSNIVRYTLDNTVGKDSLMKTSGSGTNYPCYLVILT